MRGKLQKKIDRLLSGVILVIALPLLAAVIGQRMQIEELLEQTKPPASGVAQEAEDGEAMKEGVSAETKQWEAGGSVWSTEAVEEIEEQLIGIVAKEISADAPEAALLAQCVIARTNLCDARERKMKEPEALGRKEMQSLWGEQFQECYGRIRGCVERTRGQVLLWDESCAYAAYHAVSAGKTRAMEEFYADAHMPYLCVQDCAADAVAEGYLSVEYMPEAAFLEECRRIFPDCEVSSIEDVAVTARDMAGYVTAMQVGKAACDGETFRAGFHLNSACFTITEVDGKARVVTKGRGHGFGLSQHTAGTMAEAGSSYTQILSYFYPGTVLGDITGKK